MFISRNKGSSEIWGDRHTESRRERRLCNVTEVPTHKEQRRCSVQILDNYLGVNALYINY